MRFTSLILSMLLVAGSALAKPPPKAEAVSPPSSLANLSNPDPEKVFNLDKAFAHRYVPGTFQSSKSTAPKEFYFPQKYSAKTFETRDFNGKKQSWFASLKFWAKDADLSSRTEIPNANKAADVKTAPTKDAREATKTAAVRELPGSHRSYLGPEASKLNKGINPNDPNAQPRIVNEMHELKTVDDIKALLNKN